TGATAVIAAHVDQGLLFVGDAHLAQGDAEIHRAAIEAEADVRLTVRLATAEEACFAGLPQINTAQSWGSVATGPGQLDALIRHAYDDLASRLVRGSRMTPPDAYRLLGAAGRITVGQVVPPLSSVLAWLPTRHLP